jgi:hypothetical protein
VRIATLVGTSARPPTHRRVHATGNQAHGAIGFASSPPTVKCALAEVEGSVTGITLGGQSPEGARVRVELDQLQLLLEPTQYQGSRREL